MNERTLVSPAHLGIMRALVEIGGFFLAASIDAGVAITAFVSLPPGLWALESWDFDRKVVTHGADDEGVRPG